MYELTKRVYNFLLVNLKCYQLQKYTSFRTNKHNQVKNYIKRQNSLYSQVAHTNNTTIK